MNLYVFVCTGARITKDIRIDGHLTLLFVVTPVTQMKKSFFKKKKKKKKTVGHCFFTKKRPFRLDHGLVTLILGNI